MPARRACGSAKPIGPRTLRHATCTACLLDAGNRAQKRVVRYAPITEPAPNESGVVDGPDAVMSHPKWSTHAVWVTQQN